MGFLIDIGVPVGLLYLFLQFYNHFKIIPSEMVKTSGLWAISLLGLTLLIGPLSRIFPRLSFLKAYRKSWGILSFFVALTHAALVGVYFYKWDLTKFFNPDSPKFTGILSGELALIILLLVTLTSNKKAIHSLSPETWKLIQTTSYIALALVIAHFYLMELVDGVLIIKRLLGRVTLWFSVAVIVVRIIVLLLPSKKK